MRIYCIDNDYEKEIKKFKWYDCKNSVRDKRVTINGIIIHGCHFIRKHLTKDNINWCDFACGEFGVWCDSEEKAINFQNLLSKQYNLMVGIREDDRGYEKQIKLKQGYRLYRDKNHYFRVIIDSYHKCRKLELVEFNNDSNGNYIYEWKVKDEKGRYLNSDNIPNLLGTVIKKLNREQVVSALNGFLSQEQIVRLVRHIEHENRNKVSCNNQRSCKGSEEKMCCMDCSLNNNCKERCKLSNNNKDNILSFCKFSSEIINNYNL